MFFIIIPVLLFTMFFFFSSRRLHTRWNCDWSSDVCSSDLEPALDRLGRISRLQNREAHPQEGGPSIFGKGLPQTLVELYLVGESKRPRRLKRFSRRISGP